MTPLPPLERTSNETGRLIMYAVYNHDRVYTMLKWAVVQNGSLECDLSFKYTTYDNEGLYKEMLRNGFVPMIRSEIDEPDIVCTFYNRKTSPSC